MGARPIEIGAIAMMGIFLGPLLSWVSVELWYRLGEETSRFMYDVGITAFWLSFLLIGYAFVKGLLILNEGCSKEKK